MVTEADIRLADGRTLHAYDTRADGTGAPGSPVAVFWLHGSPNVGSPPEPLFAAAEANGLRWVSYDRPGYGGSDPDDGRTVAPPPPMWPRSRTPSASAGSPCSAIPAAARTRWPAPRCCQSASSPR